MTIQISTIAQLQQWMDNGKFSSVELTSFMLNNIKQSAGEGKKVFTAVYEEQALAAATASDTLRQAGLKRSNVEGIPISIKDLFDYAGDITKSGSIVLNDALPATQHAAIVQRLIEAGAIIIGKTNMTEFAFSGLGINPHYGTPASPWNRSHRHIPGGSSSGAAVSVSDNMAVAAIGSDTGGSIRIPSAFCYLTGFKPSATRIPSKGAMPLSHNLDSFGPLARSVSCCNILDSILSGQPEKELQTLSPNHLRFLLPTNYVWDGIDSRVEKIFKEKVITLKNMGIQIDEFPIHALDEIPYITRLGGFVCADAWFHHRQLIEQKSNLYDPRVVSRILRGKNQSAADYIELLNAREEWIKKMQATLQPYDAIIMPTVPILPPTIQLLEESDEEYFKYNALILRNPTIINYLDGCAFSLPCQNSNLLPVGLMLASTHGKDEHLFNVAYSIEEVL